LGQWVIQAEGHACADEDFPWASGPGALSLDAHHGELQAPTPQSADARAIASDFLVTGNDIRAALWD